MRLHEYTSLIRSKNAGPFSLTFDIMFSDEEMYRHVKTSGVLNVRRLAELLCCSENQIRFFECDNALAFKVTIPRALPAGDPADADLHGGQQFAPLMDIEIGPLS
ncbi:DUF4387 domain-containing protein [Microvirga sp. VF16]|uniref:DUF4387 domain-containing protein n=1 Tax=Microvirga sp. VF16 TaxID=2807101 RepID=UPI00193E67A1|nr:DUF4387 domain-containing protein [Microvirga sp. VF16]QRM32662.1 DUF4387 domain-containing protein [Microvirga sp. VF16]